MPSQRILVVGGSGMLGTDLCLSARRHLPSAQLFSPRSAEVNFSKESEAGNYFDLVRPDVVINAAAYTNVDRAETERDLASALNAELPRVLAKLCDPLAIPLVHFSTDQVFDGMGELPWVESDAARPLNHYAASKWEGDQAVLRHSRNLVLRVQWLYGQAKDRFTGLRDKPVFTPVSDQFGAPSPTAQIADTVFLLLGKRASGLFHFAYDDFASWLDVYEFAKQELGLTTQMRAVTTASLSLPARRPLNARLSNRKLCQTLGVAGMGSWKQPLMEFLHRS